MRPLERLAVFGAHQTRRETSMPLMWRTMLVSILTLAYALATDWPGWRGADRSGRSTETHLLKTWPSNGPALAWKKDQLGIGFSSISIAGSRIYTMTDRGDSQFVVALELDGGKEV